MNIITEIYRSGSDLPTKDQTMEIELERMRLTEMIPYYMSHGLESLIISRTRKLHVLEKKPSIDYPIVSADEWETWRNWLPRMYFQDANEAALRSRERTGSPFMSPHREWAYHMSVYHFDEPPLPILQEWQRARSNNLFDGYGIRTLEEKATDPILVGFLGNIIYLIARWGESLVDFSDIQRLVQEKSTQEEKNLAVIRQERIEQSKKTLFCNNETCRKNIAVDDARVTIIWMSNNQGYADGKQKFGSRRIGVFCIPCATTLGMLLP
ncbi:hypothetical protein COY62_03315 [bacterium (Candidatus Howlettbacteria) CG_4_10_14_0_8_um_filter_40_9]|nr:MAG: hypothetical protein COY62_03315 [bacterium (Candidatus Howlettbacteria) CG_4_10_14_0_8_um_filter_40_9]